MNPIDLVEKPFLRVDLPGFRPGDTVKVHVRVVEAGRERIQVFQGVVIRRQGGGVRETFTVRKVSFGVGVERTFPVHSPTITKVEVVSRGHVRRAKLYYLRERRGKKARIRERRGANVELMAARAEEAEEVAEGAPADQPSDGTPTEASAEPEAGIDTVSDPAGAARATGADEPSKERA